MSWPRWCLGVFLISLASAAQAQTRNTVLQAHFLGTDASADFLGVGIGLGRRTGGRLTTQIALTPGVVDRSFAVRGEGLLTFSLDPARRQGVSPYGGGGVAAVFTRSSTEAFLVLLLGVEAAPQAGSGWFAEVGVGGGVRGSVGWRLRD